VRLGRGHTVRPRSRSRVPWLKTSICCLVAGAAWGFAPAVFAQTVSPSAGTAPSGQDPLIRDLQQRLQAQEAVNAELQRRVAALEALLPRVAADPPRPPAPPAAPPADEATVRLEERLDALPKIGGYYDFEYSKSNTPGTFSGFRQHRVFLDVFKEYQKFRVMSEVEFESAALVSGGVAGVAEPQRGKVSVEQTWAEYVRSEALTVRAGFILTPNYWNVNAYANVTVSTRPPLMVREIFPESFVGVMAYGTKYRDSLGVGYTAYVSNGQGTDFGEHDDNSAKGVGGVLRFELPTRGVFDTLKVSATGYADTSADGTRTRTWGAESQVRRGPFELLFEFGDRRAVEDGRGAYLQPSYRLTERVTGFYRYDWLRTGLDGGTQANTWGVDLRPIPPVSLKFEFFSATRPGTRRVYGLASSLAVAF
jgi:hypothetical protein